MAYGLDFEEIYYTDHNRTDLGVLQTYDIKVDVADEKDFQITSPEPILQVGGFWYILDMEYGGIVDAFETDSDDVQIIYTGRTFRGILHSHYVLINGIERVIPDNTTDAGTADISNCIRQLITESGLDNVFSVDDPDIDESIDPTLNNYIVKQGTSLYDAIIGAASSIGFTVILNYRKDKKIHITPILIQDYVDYLKGSKYDGLGFKTELDTAVVNHLIVHSVNDDINEGLTVVTAHFFTDENGGLQPYAFVDNPIKDEQYIKDTRSQVLFGLDEITEFQEMSLSTVENYEPLAYQPADWNMTFANYFYKETDEETGEVSIKQYEVKMVTPYNPVTTQPADWTTNYKSYFTGTYDEEEQKWSYQNVNPDTTLDKQHPHAVTVKPTDWIYNYSDYYYKFQTGTGFDYLPYETVTKYKYVRMTKKPSDWDTNFGSYYRKVYEIEVTENGKKKKKLIDTLKDSVNGHKAKYVTCKKGDDGEENKKPKFSTRPHFRKDSYEEPPKFKKDNCYTLDTIEIAPEFNNILYSYFAEGTPVIDVPEFTPYVTHQKVLDHYAGMVEQAVNFFEDERKKSNVEMEVDYLNLNIGDVLGGTDEFTSTNIVGKISNIEATIENGLIDVIYKVVIQNYSSNLINGSIEEG